MIDPLLRGFDMPIMIEMPVTASDVPHLDAVLITHSDNDHYSIPTRLAKRVLRRKYPHLPARGRLRILDHHPTAPSGNPATHT